jgi:hypothetical protein
MMVNPQEIKQFISTLGTWFSIHDDGLPNPNSGVHLTTREHGDVGDEEPGEADWEEARRVAKAVREKFGDAVKISGETIDEWTDLNITVVKAEADK